MKLRIEPIEVGQYAHVYNRGNRGMPIFRDISDIWHFLKIIRFFNDKNSSEHLFQKMKQKSGFDPAHPFKFEWPKEWPAQEPVVKILSYCVKWTHFHLLLKEIITGGISFFMKKLGNALTSYIHIKYEEVGRIFQSSYHRRVIPIDKLEYLDAYIQVFNPMEDLKGGIEWAMKNFEQAFEEVLKNPFSSLEESFGLRNLKIIERDILAEKLPNLEAYKEFCRDAILVHHLKERLGKLTLE